MMKKNTPIKKQETTKSGVVHIDSEVHKKLKIFCATKNKDMGKFASEVLKQSLKKFSYCL